MTMVADSLTRQEPCEAVHIFPTLAVRLGIPTCYTAGTRSEWPIGKYVKTPSNSELTEGKKPTIMRNYVALEGSELAE